jgi:hypothetical protein
VLSPAVREEHPHLRVAFAARVAWAKSGRAVGRSQRKLHVRAEAAIVLIVIVLDDDAAIGELALEVEAVGVVKRADDRLPVRAVGMNAPDAPVDAAVQPLRLQRAEDDPPVGEHHRVQCAGHVQMADLFHVAAVVVHDVELQGVLRVAARRFHRVAIRGEDNLAAGKRAGAEIVDAVR